MSEDSTIVDRRRDARSEEEPRSYSLVEVAQETGISMPILLRYKREHPERIPSSGSGSQQRFPEDAFQIFRQIQREEGETRDLPRRGGFGLLSLPRVRRAHSPEPEEESTAQETAAQAPAAPTAAAQAPAQASVKAPVEAPARRRVESRPAASAASAPAAGEAKLTLGQIAEELGIPYPTLARYSNQHEDRIPHVGSGRNRRFPPEAVEVFRRIRAESRPGRPPKAKAPKEASAVPASPKAPRAPAAPPATVPAEPVVAPARTQAPFPQEGDLARRIESLERSQQALEREIRTLIEALTKPATVTIHQV